MASVRRQHSQGPRRVLLTALVDVAVAAVVAVIAFRAFGAVSGVDTHPPQCYSASGGVVSCALTPPAVMLPTFALVLVGLVLWQWRHRRDGRPGRRSSAG